MKTYSTRGNARRAALASFGPEAEEETHFRILRVTDGYAVEVIAAEALPVVGGASPRIPGSAHDLGSAATGPEPAEGPPPAPAGGDGEAAPVEPGHADDEIPAFLRRDEAHRAAGERAAAASGGNEGSTQEAACEPTMAADGPAPGEGAEAEDAHIQNGAAAPDAVASAINARPRRARPDSKQARLIAMLSAPQGATIDEIATAFEWQAHTVRGALAGALKRRLGLATTSEKVEGRGRVYRIVG